MFIPFPPHRSFFLGGGVVIDRYKQKFRCFNDDIQGTGSVCLAGVMGALRVRGQKISGICIDKGLTLILTLTPALPLLSPTISMKVP
jgi:hypothetical protein